MDKNKMILSIGIIIIAVTMILGLIYLNFDNVRLKSLSEYTIVRGYEQNTIDGEVVITIDGEGFKEGDKIYVNNNEVNTAIGNPEYLSFLINPELYEKAESLTIQLKRNTPQGNIFLKSNKKIIEIITAKEMTDKLIFIDKVWPEKIKTKQTGNLIDNKVAISVIGNGFLNGDVIYIEGKPQPTTFGDESVLTCLIPQEFSIDYGEIDVQIKRKKNVNITNIISVSNIIKLKVEQ